MENQLEEIFIEVPWGKLCVVARGPKDGPSVILLHGNQDTASTFFPLIKHFPDNFRLFMLELPGCGKSTILPLGKHIYSYDYIYSLKLTVDYLKLETFTFIGHSMGFQIGLLYNAIYSDKISRLIALDSVSYDPIESETFPLWYIYTYENFYDPYKYKKLTSGPEFGPKYTYERALEIVMNNRGLTKEAGECVLERALIPCGDGQFKFCWDQRMKYISLPTMNFKFQEELMGKIKIPHLTVLAYESIQRRIETSRVSLFKTHIKNNPNYRVVVVEGNHDVHLNKPDVIASHVVPFLLGNDVLKRSSEKLKREFMKFTGEKMKMKLKSRL